MSETKRIMYLDIARGIAIISVIIGHYIQLVSLQYVNVIYCFHMPLFFLISGTFIKKNVSVDKLFEKKSKQLLRPYLLVSTIWALGVAGKNFLQDGTEACIEQFLKSCHAIFIGGGQSIRMLWFLLALFWGSIFTQIVLFITKKKIQFVAVLLISVIGYLSSSIVVVPWNIQQGMVATSYLYIGYILKNGNWIERIYKNKKYAAILSVVSVAIWVIVARNSLMEMWCNRFKYGFIDWGAAILVSYIIMLFALFLSNSNVNSIKKLAAWFGINSMYLFSVHYLDYRWFGFIVLKFVKIKNYMLQTVLVILITLVLYCSLVQCILIFKNFKKDRMISKI